jgi:hypothetical protein
MDSKPHIQVRAKMEVVGCALQSLVVRSSTESELIRRADGVSEVLQVQRILDFHKYATRPALIYLDNLSTNQGTLSTSMCASSFVKQRIDGGDVKIQYLPTDDITAVLLTKPLLGHQCYKLRAKVMNHPTTMCNG